MQAGAVETESNLLIREAYGHRPGFRLDWYEGRREAAHQGFRMFAVWSFRLACAKAAKLRAGANGIGFRRITGKFGLVYVCCFTF